MYPRYKCYDCGNVWHSNEIVAVCPVCRGKGVKIKGVDNLNYRKEVWKLLKEYEGSKSMSLKEVLDKIMAVPVPGKRGRIADNRGLGDKHLPI